MFLPTKAHDKEIINKQYKIRLGNHVPKDAVNIAASFVPEVNSTQNVLITDLSNVIHENSINGLREDIIAFSDESHLLVREDDTSSIASNDILITSVYQEGVPLYYSCELSYHLYDEMGPDEHGNYLGRSIVVVDRENKPVMQPYKIKIVRDENLINMYKVIVYTSFYSNANTEYHAVYNAIEAHEDGSTQTLPGYKEMLNLTRAYKRTDDINKILSDPSGLSFYTAKDIRPGFNRVYVGKDYIIDNRQRDDFRYMIGFELETPKERYTISSPWYSSYVEHVDSLIKDELVEYTNEYRQITKQTLSEIMQDFIDPKFFDDTLYPQAIRRYFVSVDNANIKEVSRADGSSPLFAKVINKEAKPIIVPDTYKRVEVPREEDYGLDFKLRPLASADNENGYISMIIDNSKSMAVNDPGRTLRHQIIEGVIESAIDYYNGRVNVNGWMFNNGTHEISEYFLKNTKSFLNAYKQQFMEDQDITNPISGVYEGIESLKQVTTEFGTDAGKRFTNHKYVVLITDGHFDQLAVLENAIAGAKNEGIYTFIITYNNYEKLNAICTKYGTSCIWMNHPEAITDVRHLFSELAGNIFNVTLNDELYFSISPTENAKAVGNTHPGNFSIPKDIKNNLSRYGIEITMKDSPDKKYISIFLKNKVTDKILPTINGRYIVKLDGSIQTEHVDIFVTSNAWTSHFYYQYSMYLNDKKIVKVLPPREKKITKSWYPIVQNGQFDRVMKEKGQNITYHYAIPEYHYQPFLSDYPTRIVQDEVPDVITGNEVSLMYTPLAVKTKDGIVTNIKAHVNGKEIGIKSWNIYSGVIELNGMITANDDVRITYEYHEDFYTYKGFYDEETNHFWHLDLNPTVGHYITYRDDVDGVIQDIPSFNLIDKVVYLYMHPICKIEYDSKGNMLPPSNTKKYALRHTFEKSIDKMNVLLAEVRVRPNSTRHNIKLIDTRVRGGGLKESITKEMMMAVEKESAYYWDIGHWDGEPYPENGIVIIRITKSTLKQYGGLFTEAEVEEKLYKYLGYGILPIIEYLDEPDMLLETPSGLSLSVIDVQDIGRIRILQPTFNVKVGDSNG